jgi:hypothetical protein
MFFIFLRILKPKKMHSIFSAEITWTRDPDKRKDLKDKVETIISGWGRGEVGESASLLPNVVPTKLGRFLFLQRWNESEDFALVT